MENELAKDNQVLLFLNRRGYSVQLACVDCGYVFGCEKCERPYTYYRHWHRLKCNCCLDELPIPQTCPHCNSPSLMPFGAGTEQIEDIVGDIYDAKKVIRIDRDTSSNQKNLEKNLDSVLKTKGAVLIGTQMLAKGHHFPDITLVALLNIDGLLYSRDFRSVEKLAQLYVQVAGRAGRESKQGHVVLQTSYAHDQVYKDLLSLSYFNFAKIYLEQRRIQNQPPFTHQVYFGIRHGKSEVLESLENFTAHLIELTINEFKNNYPHEMAEFNYALDLIKLDKRNNYYNSIVSLTCTDRSLRTRIAIRVRELFYEAKYVKSTRPIFYIDVDPCEL